MNQLKLDNSERYCVFRNDGSWYGLPALAVRNIVHDPRITPAPYSDPILHGICHTQNEFIPVVSLQALTEIQYDKARPELQQLMILLGPQGPWGLMIDEAVALAALETSISTFSNNQDRWAKATLGSASYQNHVLQILDPTAIYEYAASLIDGFWHNVDQTDLQLTLNS